MTRTLWIPSAACALALISACAVGPAYPDLGGDDDSAPEDPGTGDVFVFWSPAFGMGGAIPVDYTCQGTDHSPPLAWKDVPEGTESFAIVVVDQDAGNFGHWGIYDIPATVTSLEEGVSPNGGIPAGSSELINGFLQRGYGGPCPPEEHQYAFTLVAIAVPSLDITPYDTFDDLLEEAAAQALDYHTFSGTYAP